MFESYALAIGLGRHRHALGAQAVALGVPVRLEAPDLLLVGTEGTTFLADGNTILVGQAFDQSSERLTSLPARLQAEGCIDLRSALHGIWGNYALFAASAGRSLVYREPSGSVPVYRCGGQDQTVFVSDAEFALELSVFGRPEIDPDFLVHWLQFPFLRTARSGLQDVSELLPGMCAASAGSGRWTETPLWHPSTFAVRSRAIEDPWEAANCLRETALSVVGAQPSGARPVLRLSGGLDSSIIAACLSEAKLLFSCINFATRSRDGDERDYASEVARTFDLSLVEVPEPEDVGLAAPLRKSFRPLINPLLEPFERAVSGAADELGATLLIDGGGGDNLFCSITSAAPVIDALSRGAIGKAMVAIGDIANRADCTVWKVLGAAGRRLLRRQRLWREDRSFLRADAVLENCEPHPWLQGLRLPPGKGEHVEALVHIQHFLDRAPSSIALVHPLLAQPLLELCLSIPSWLWVGGGRDRAIARDAFAGLVPSSVLERRMKGSLQSLLYRSFAKLRLDIRELLLDGELASAGIIDSAAIDRALAGEEWKSDMVQLRISEMVALELWVRSWQAEAADPSSAP